MKFPRQQVMVIDTPIIHNNHKLSPVEFCFVERCKRRSAINGLCKSHFEMDIF